MATPHINAEKDQIADIVLMPGDPLRAKLIADNYLTNVKQFNQVRNMFGYTGYYNGRKVSVMGSGMGMPSMGIYSYELFKFYDVKKIIRIGSCGALTKDLNIYDLILVNSAYSDSTYAYVQNGSTDKTITSSLNLTNKMEEIAKKEEINIIRGNIYTSDVFYKENFSYDEIINKYHCLAVEMETFALFHNAKVLSKEAACILTVSDSLVTKEEISAKARENNFITMIELVLKSI
ncbi:MAG: purine-nucleoside phosphorylase [Bacilli bacterium]|jgi:purine-nucleoside phosphorylase|nr:purine-nucleoside phosphorylase [Bacilli bacterium]